MKELHIRIKLPRDISSDQTGLEDARQAARESGVLKLWEVGLLSTEQAAERMGLSEQSYLTLVTAKGMTVKQTEIAAQPPVRPIEDVLEEIGASIPDEAWATLPDDYSSQLDHYIYGWPKR